MFNFKKFFFLFLLLTTSCTKIVLGDSNFQKNGEINTQLIGKYKNNKEKYLYNFIVNKKKIEILNNDVNHLNLINSNDKQINNKITVFNLKQISQNIIEQKFKDIHNLSLNLQNKIFSSNQKINELSDIKYHNLVFLPQNLNLNHDKIKHQLTFNWASILRKNFWSMLLEDQSLYIREIGRFFTKIYDTVLYSWKPAWRFDALIWLSMIIFMMTIGHFYSKKFISWIIKHKIPKGRLSHSFFSILIVFNNVILMILTFSFAILGIDRCGDIATNSQEIIKNLEHLGIYCSLIMGLGRSLLYYHLSSKFRLFNIYKELILTLRPFPTITALLIFILQTLELFNNSIENSISITIFINGINALLISFVLLSINALIKRFEKKQIAITKSKLLEKYSKTFFFIRIVLIGTAIIILILLILGYFILASLLSYQIIWFGVLFSSYYLLNHFINDIYKFFQLKQTYIIEWTKNYLKINKRHLQQILILITAFCKVLLIFFISLELLNGSIISISPMNIEFVQKSTEFWKGKGLEYLNIVPAHIINALLFLTIGIYILRYIRCWLNNVFLPKTNMEIGIRISLVTLFSNVSYVIIILITLSIMGLQWNKLAWIVSALSVGIGFGLQEIVKNFISGLILLTERPIKVGDLISISGIEGDILRINVRATEIQLKDKSTVIMPNSQFISQSFRNATMGNPQGLVTITLTFPLDIDIIQVCQILLQVYRENKNILVKPEPSVSFKDITSHGIILSVTGYVSNHRQISNTKSDLLLNILISIKNNNIVLSIPQSILIKN